MINKNNVENSYSKKTKCLFKAKLINIQWQGKRVSVFDGNSSMPEELRSSAILTVAFHLIHYET